MALRAAEPQTDEHSQQWAHVHYTGPEAYEVTAMAAVTGAIVILEELQLVQRQSGLVTPAYAFHNTSFVPMCLDLEGQLANWQI
eukprot:s468_g8.t1